MTAFTEDEVLEMLAKHLMAGNRQIATIVALEHYKKMVRYMLDHLSLAELDAIQDWVLV